MIEAAQGLLEPGDVGLAVALQAAIAQEPAPVVLGAEHVDELAAPGDEFAQRGGLRSGHGAGRWAHRATRRPSWRLPVAVAPTRQ